MSGTSSVCLTLILYFHSIWWRGVTKIDEKWLWTAMHGSVVATKEGVEVG